MLSAEPGLGLGCIYQVITAQGRKSILSENFISIGIVELHDSHLFSLGWGINLERSDRVR